VKLLLLLHESRRHGDGDARTVPGWRSPRPRSCTDVASPSRTFIPCIQWTGNESVPIQLAQCWFPRPAISNAKIWVYFSNKIYGSSFIKTALGNCYGLKLPKCWLQFNRINLVCNMLFIKYFGTLSFPIGQKITYMLKSRRHLQVVSFRLQKAHC